MIKKIYEFIDDYVRDNIIFKAIVFLLIGTIAACFAFCSVIDRTPATEADYKPLIQQREAISKISILFILMIIMLYLLTRII